MKSLENMPFSAKFFFSISEGLFSMIPFKEELRLSDAYNSLRKINTNYNCIPGKLAGGFVAGLTYTLLIQRVSEYFQ